MYRKEHYCTIAIMTTQIISAYREAHRRLILLDYDGTLVRFRVDPMACVPDKPLLSTLRALAAQSGTTVVVISGRSTGNLEDWLGDTGVVLVAEHGFTIKRPGQAWRHEPIDTSWKAAVLPLFEAAVKAVPGSFIADDKMSGIVWHYRAVADDVALPTVRDLVKKLEPIAEKHHIRCLPGNKFIEMKVATSDKGVATRELLDEQPWDFVLAAGDDTTDEDMLAVLPDNAFGIKIGEGPSAARLRLKDATALRALLRQLAKK